MGSSKLISNRELFHIVFILHQGIGFWVLPYFIANGNGTAGFVILLPALAVGLLILGICSFWSGRCREIGFVQALPQMLGKPLGKLLGAVLVLFYATFTLVSLCSFVEMLHGQFLLETPKWVLLVTMFLLAGWLSYNGLEDMARMAVLCTAVMVVLLLFVVAGNGDVFSLQNMLPLHIKDGALLQRSMLQSIYGYSGLMALFMIYPAVNTRNKLNRQLGLSLLLSTVVIAIWTVMALGVFGQSSVGPVVWLPLELARMVQLGPFLERTEVIFVILWMAVVFLNGSLLVWCVSEGSHQLLERKKNPWLHWGLVLVLLGLGMAIKDMLQLFQLQQLLSGWNVWLLLAVLLLIVLGSWRYGRRKEEPQNEAS